MGKTHDFFPNKNQCSAFHGRQEPVIPLSSSWIPPNLLDTPVLWILGESALAIWSDLCLQTQWRRGR